MADGFFSKFKKAWNVFSNKDPTTNGYGRYGIMASERPDKRQSPIAADKSIAKAIFNRIAIDVSMIDFHHVKLDENGRMTEYVNSGLEEIFTVEANIDQTARAFRQDLVESMMEEGVIALVPIDTDVDPRNATFDILSARVGKIMEWKPEHVVVEVYNQLKGQREQLTVSKRTTAIIENPLYSVINSQNSTLSRLIRKLALLDSVDDKNSSGRLDLIVQLPYIVKSEARKKQAEERRKDIEDQLSGSKYGVAYTDGTEKITQLNRPIENQLLEQVKMLTEQLFAQLGLTQEILNGTANEQTMLNYYDRTIEPICCAIAEECKRKFISKTSRTQGQSIAFYRDPFKLVPVSQLANVADSFTRNAIMTSNEFRQIIGMKPSDAQIADELSNKNLYPDQQGYYDPAYDQAQLDPSINRDEYSMEEQIQNG